MADELIPAPEEQPVAELPRDVYLSIGGPPPPPAEGPGGTGPMAPVASGTPGAPFEAQPPFTLERAPAPAEPGPSPLPFDRDDLTTAPPEYWVDLERGYAAGEIPTEDFYAAYRQRTLDEESEMLANVRAMKLAALPAPAAPAEQAAPAEAMAPAAPPPSTTEQISHFLASVGVRGPQPLNPMRQLVANAYADDPAKDKNPVYRTLDRIAWGVDAALTGLNVPITGLGDIGALVFALGTVGLREAGYDKATVEGFIQKARMLPELAGAFAVGAPGVLGAAGKVGNLVGLGAEVAPLIARAAKVVKGENAFTATMREVWTSERGEIRIPGPGGAPIDPGVLLPTPVETLAEKYKAARLEARRGGTRTREQVEAAAQALIDQGGMTLDDIRAIVPSTTLDADHLRAMHRLLTDEGLRVKTIAERALLTKSSQDYEHLRKQFHAFALTLDPPRLGVMAETGRAEATFNDPVQSERRFLDQFSFAALDQTKGVSDEMLARMVASFQNPGQLGVFAKQATKPGFWDMFNEYYVNGLLWGPVSWQANFLGNGVTALWSVPERKMAELVGAGFDAIGLGRGVEGGEAWELMHGYLGGQLDAWRYAAKSFATAEKSFRPEAGGMVSKTELRRQRSISSEALERTGAVGAGIDVLGTIIRVPEHILQGTDEYYRVMAWMGQHRAVALREAKQELLAEGLTGKQAAEFLARRIQDKMADPPLSITKDADAFSLYQTLQTELGPYGQWLQKGSRLPAMKVLLPIVRTPTNAAKFIGVRTPFMLLHPRFWREVTGSDKVLRDTAMAQVLLGSGVMGIAALWFLNGDFTSGGPSDPRLRKDMTDNLGWIPYARRVGNHYIGVPRLEPPGMIMGLGSDLADAILNGDPETDEADWEEAAVAASVAIAKSFSNRTMVRSMAETMTFFANPERQAETRLTNLMQSLFPLSGFQRQYEKMIDPELRAAAGIIERLRAKTPGVSSIQPPEVTLDGDPIYVTGRWGPISISKLKDDPVAQERIKVGARIPDLPKAPEFGIVPTVWERHYWAVQRGKMEVGGLTVRQRQEQTIKSDFYQRADQQTKANLLERDILLHQRAAWQKTKANVEEFPNLQSSIDEARAAKLQKLREGAKPEDDVMTPLMRSLTPR